MTLLQIIESVLIGLGLAMDCFAVSLTTGFSLECITKKSALRLAFFFGLFQGLMPLLGWLLGFVFQDAISTYDHWIAFAILTVIGGKMLINAIKEKPGERSFNINKWVVIISLSVATSIDALIVGMSFPFMKISIIPTVIIIALVTFLLSLIGLFFGKKFSLFFGNKAEALGGIILILIGTKTLLEHLGILTY